MESLEKTITRFNEPIDWWVMALENYDHARLIIQPDPESWSIGQVYVHLMDETGYYFQQCRDCLAGGGSARGKMTEEGKKLFRMRGLPDEKISGPANVYNVHQPVDKVSLRAGMMELKRQVNELGEKVRFMKTSGKTKHPGLGWFGAVDWYRFAEMHLRHHVRQKERIDRFLGIDI